MQRARTLRLTLFLHLTIALTLITGGMAIFQGTAFAATSFNNEGISTDASPGSANFDSHGYS